MGDSEGVVYEKQGLTRLFVVVVVVVLQLQTEADLIWLREKLCIGKTNEEASLHFRAKIKESLTCERTMLNNFFHIMKHR